MKRPILVLNVVLACALIAGSVELRRRWLEARRQETKVLAVQPVPAVTAESNASSTAQPQGKLQSAQYFEVAERFLFARDRNPTVIVEKKPEPPPKVMPNFPAVHGVMDVGMGPTIYISVENDRQQGFRLGDKISEFTLKAATQKDITFEWDGKAITKTLDELRPKTNEAQQGPPQMASNSNNAAGFAPPPPPQKPPENVKPAPGVDIGNGRKGCISGDNSAAGTVVDGYKKVSYAYAFGPICYWEPTR